MEVKHNTGYDIVRLIASFMVVVIHSEVIFLAANEKTTEWFLGMEISALCLISVPLFFMISGAGLLQKNRLSTAKQYKRRFLKQFIPFVCWSFLYLVARTVLGKTDMSFETIVGLLREPAYYQFWFMYSLLAIYLLLPVLEIVIQNSSKRRLEYILLIWLFFSVFQPTLAAFYPILSLSPHIDLVLCEGYIGFFLLGYYLREYGRKIPRKGTVWLMIIGIAAIVIPAGLEYGIAADAYKGYFFRTYLTPGVVLGAAGVFLFFQNSLWKVNRSTCCLSKLTLGVFYIHMLVLTAFEYSGFTGADRFGVCMIKAIAVFVVSLLITAGMRRWKWINKFFLGGS